MNVRLLQLVEVLDLVVEVDVGEDRAEHVEVLCVGKGHTSHLRGRLVPGLTQEAEKNRINVRVLNEEVAEHLLLAELEQYLYCVDLRLRAYLIIFFEIEVNSYEVAEHDVRVQCSDILHFLDDAQNILSYIWELILYFLNLFQFFTQILIIRVSFCRSLLRTRLVD